MLKKWISDKIFKFKRCSKCGEIKSVTEFSKDKHNKNGLRSSCKECIKEYDKKYRQTEKGKLVQQRMSKKYYKKHKKERREYHKKYQRTNKGKESMAKHRAKRKRNLGWIKLYDNPFTPNIKIHWHHINNTYVVALPQWLHTSHYGKYHRVKLLPLELQIYPNLLEMLSNKLNNRQK